MFGSCSDPKDIFYNLTGKEVSNLDSLLFLDSVSYQHVKLTPQEFYECILGKPLHLPAFVSTCIIVHVVHLR
jgi:hypothetical protein